MQGGRNMAPGSRGRQPSYRAGTFDVAAFAGAPMRAAAPDGMAVDGARLGGMAVDGTRLGGSEEGAALA